MRYLRYPAGITLSQKRGARRLPCPHALLAERQRVIVFVKTADAGTPQGAAGRFGAAMAALGIERFDLLGEGAGAAAALWLALAPRRTSVPSCSPRPGSSCRTMDLMDGAWRRPQLHSPNNTPKDQLIGEQSPGEAAYFLARKVK
jgi:pimeloyl-ACP methyl ester carboxylesterase